MKNNKIKTQKLINNVGRKINLGILVWIIPVIALFLVLAVTIFSRERRKQKKDISLPGKLFRAKIESVINPLKLTSYHFASLSDNFIIPNETLKRHLKLLKKVYNYHSLAIFDNNVITVSAGNKNEIDKMRNFYSKFKNNSPFLGAILRKSKIFAYILAIPIKPSDNKVRWLVATIGKEINNKLPEGISIIYSREKLDDAVIDFAPNLYFKAGGSARPIWPLLFGELLLALGILIIILYSKNRR